MKAIMAGALALLASPLLAASAAAQLSNPSPASPILGTVTLATMPVCDTTRQGKYVFVTDLGGGADMTLCDGTSWKHIRLGSPATVSAASGTVTVTPLSSAPIEILTGNITTTLNVSIATVGLYDGEIFYFRRPGALTGAIGVSLASGGISFPLLGNASMMLVYSTSCTCLVQVQ